MVEKCVLLPYRVRKIIGPALIKMSEDTCQGTSASYTVDVNQISRWTIVDAHKAVSCYGSIWNGTLSAPDWLEDTLCKLHGHTYSTTAFIQNCVLGGARLKHWVQLFMNISTFALCACDIHSTHSHQAAQQPSSSPAGDNAMKARQAIYAHTARGFEKTNAAYLIAVLLQPGLDGCEGDFCGRLVWKTWHRQK